jgi:hypothetical protein
MSVINNMQVQNSPSQATRGRLWGLMWIACLGLAATVVGLSGCSSKVFYTQEYRIKVDSAHINPSKLQFYNDKEFLIRRKTVTKEVKSEEGIVTSTEGLRVQDIRVRRGTPCRVDSVSGNYYYMSFEIGEGNTVRFYKNSFDYYQIGADKWVRGRGSVKYGGKECEIERIGNDCLLMVKNYQTFKDKKERRVARGVEVGTDGAQMRDTMNLDEEDIDQ